MADVPKILVTGAAGKVGQAFIGRLLASGEDRFAGFTVRALCHNRILEAGPRLEVMTGSIDQRATAERATDGVTHVLHLATSKETPQTILDVAVKGLFWLLEACRAAYPVRSWACLDGPSFPPPGRTPRRPQRPLPAVRNLEEFRSPGAGIRSSGWKQALQAFTIYFDGRIPTP